jgi:hypothetical protein
VTGVNGEPGILTYRSGRVIAATMFAFESGCIQHICHVVNPDKLTAIPEQIDFGGQRAT